MVRILWAFRVRAGCNEQFEQRYSAMGDWALLFSRSTEYRGTLIARDLTDPRRYVTIDRWTSSEAFDAFKRAWSSEYDALDAACAELTDDERLLGVAVEPEDEPKG